MAALEASVKAAVEARGQTPPTSVKAARSAKDVAAVEAKGKADAEANAEASPPARRRKSA
jgi:hypothetical protein